MGILGDIFDFADDLVSIPTDHEKKKALEKAKQAFLDGKLSSSEYEKIKAFLT